MNNIHYQSFIYFLKDKKEFTNKDKENIKTALGLLNHNQLQEVKKIGEVDKIIIQILRDYIYYGKIPIQEKNILESNNLLINY